MIACFLIRMGLMPHYRDVYCFDERASDGHALLKRYGWAYGRAERIGPLQKDTKYSILALTPGTERHQVQGPCGTMGQARRFQGRRHGAVGNGDGHPAAACWLSDSLGQRRRALPPTFASNPR